MADDGLDDKSKDELYVMATAAEIEGRSSMGKDELVKALRAHGKKGATSTFVTPRENQGEEHPEHRPPRDLTGPGGTIPPSDHATADQSSLGGSGAPVSGLGDGISGGTTPTGPTNA
jgi:hypothetical protein